MDLVAEYWQVFLTSFIVILALLVVYLVARRWSRRIGTGGGARLAVTEVEDIDQTRRLVLIRRDGVEHLLLVGGGHDLVVETNITRRGAGMTDEPASFGRDYLAPEPHRAPEPSMTRRETPVGPNRSEPPLFSGREPRYGADTSPPEPPPVDHSRDYAEEDEPYYAPDTRRTRRDDPDLDRP